MSKSIALLPIALLVWSASASAQIITREPADEAALIALHGFGRCIAESNPRAARKVLALDFRTAGYRESFRRLARGHSRCLPPRSSLRTGQVLVAGAVAEALLKLQVKERELVRRLAFEPSRPPLAARTEGEVMALCTVVQAPAQTAGLLSTGPGSREEAAATQALEPKLRDCLAKGSNARLNRPALRAVLALAAWRVASIAPAREASK